MTQQMISQSILQFLDQDNLITKRFFRVPTSPICQELCSKNRSTKNLLPSSYRATITCLVPAKTCKTESLLPQTRSPTTKRVHPKKGRRQSEAPKYIQLVLTKSLKTLHTLDFSNKNIKNRFIHVKVACTCMQRFL